MTIKIYPKKSLPIWALIALVVCCQMSCPGNPGKNIDEGQQVLEPAKDSFRLTYVRSTDRISSNHFSDVVLDSNGNAYIAAFAKKSGPDDHISIIKLTPDGSVAWDLGNDILGRACAISIDSNDHIWVAGFFYEHLRFGSKMAFGAGGQTMFLAAFDQEGNCLKLTAGIAPGAAYDVQVNNRQEILVRGEGRTGFEKSTGDGKSGFIAVFDAEGQISWANPFSGAVSGIGSDSEGNFLLSGQFHDTLAYGQRHLSTQGSYDNDGFLMKIRPDGQLLWMKQFGSRGIVRRGYRTQESIQDIAIEQDGTVLAIGLFEAPVQFPGIDPKNNSLFTNKLLLLDGSGQLLAEKTVAEFAASKAGVSILVCDAENKIWISGSLNGPADLCGQTFNYPEQQSYLLTLDRKTFQCQHRYFPEHEPGMAFRSGFTRNSQVVFTGHFQTVLQMGRDTLTNSGAHGIFLLSWKPAQ